MKKLINSVIGFVCDYQDVNKDMVLSNSRKAHIVRTRNIITYILHTEYKLQFEEIGEHLNKEPSTLLKNMKQFENELKNNNYINTTVKVMINELRKME